MPELTLGTRFEATGAREVVAAIQAIKGAFGEIAQGATKTSNSLKALAKSAKDARVGIDSSGKQMTAYATEVKKAEDVGKKFADTFRKLARNAHKDSEQVKRIADTMHKVRKAVKDVITVHGQYLDTLKKDTSALNKNSDEYEKAIQHNKKLTAQKKRLAALLNQEQLYIKAVSGQIQAGTKGVHQYAQGVMKASDAIQKLSPPTTRLLNENTKFRKEAEALNKQIKKGNISFEEAQKELYELKKRMKDTQDRAKGLGDIFSRLSNSAKTLVSYGVAGAAIYKVVGAAKAGVDAIVEYDQALHNLEAISYDATATQSEMATNMSLLDAKIRSVAEGTKFSATEVAKGAQLLVQAGLSATEAIGAIEATSTLATGTLSDMATSADLMTSSIRAFNLNAEDSGRIADVMANAVNKSKLTIDKLRTAFNYVGATASQAGLSIEEAAATMMTLSNSGIRASTIGTGMRQMLRRLIAPTRSTQKEMAKLGISLEELNPKTQGWSQVVKNLAGHLTNADGKTVNMVKAFNLFGLRGAQAAAVIAAGFNNKRYQTAIENVYRVGTASEMAAKQSEGLGVKIKNLVDRMKLLAIAVGDSGVGKAMGFFLDVLRSVFKNLAWFAGTEFGRVVTQIALLTTAIGAATVAWIAFTKTMAADSIKRVTLDIIYKTKMMWADTAATTAATGAQGLLVRSTKMLRAAFLALKGSMPFLLIASAITTLIVTMVSLSGRNKRLLQESREQVATFKKNAQILENYNATLGGLTEGTREYKSTLTRMLSENPELEKSLRRVTGVVDVSTLSYKDLDKAMREVHFEEMNKALAEQEEVIKRTRAELEKLAGTGGDESSMVFDSTSTEEYKQALDAVNQAEAERAKILAQQIISGQKTTEQVQEHIQTIEGAGPAAEKLNASINQAIEASNIQAQAALTSFREFISGLPPQYQEFYNSLDNIRKADFASVVENISKEQDAYAKKAMVLGLSEKEMAATQKTIRDKALSDFYANAEKETQTAETTSKRKIDAYKMFDVSRKSMNKAFVTSVKQTWEAVYRVVKTNIDKAKAELERIKGDIAALTDTMLENERRHQDGLTEIRQSTMTEEQKYFDSRKTAQEQYHTAIQALAKATASGDKEAIEKAISSVKAAQDASKQLLGGVKDADGQVVVSAQQAASEVTKMWTDGNAKIAQAQESMLGKMRSDYETAKEKLAGVEQKLKDVKQAITDLGKESVQIDVKGVSDAIHQLHQDSEALKAAVGLETKVNINSDAVTSAKNEVIAAGQEMEKLDGKTSTMTVYINKVEKNSAGGLVGGILKLSRGFKLPGYSREDTVPALLTAGERVTNALSTRVWDTVYPGFMSMMNRVKNAGEAMKLVTGVAPKKFAGGGKVGGGSVSPISNEMYVNIGLTGVRSWASKAASLKPGKGFRSAIKSVDEFDSKARSAMETVSRPMNVDVDTSKADGKMAETAAKKKRYSDADIAYLKNMGMSATDIYDMIQGKVDDVGAKQKEAGDKDVERTKKSAQASSDMYQGMSDDLNFYAKRADGTDIVIPVSSDSSGAEKDIENFRGKTVDKSWEMKVKANLEDLRAALAEYKKKGTVHKIIGGEWVEVPVNADDEQAKKDIAELTKPETKVVTVVTKKKEAKAAGGFAGEFVSKARQVLKLAAGRILPGYGGGDKIDAVLEAGEGVIPKRRVRQYGRGFIQSIIDGTLESAYPVVKLAQGGIVDNKPSGSSGGDGMLAIKDLGKMDIPVGGKSYSVISKPNILKDLEKALKREALAGAI